MIKANELRIGNWVRHGSAPIQIKRIDKNIGQLTDGSGDLFGINLTPEILEKCGFMKIVSGGDNYADEYELENIKLTVAENIFAFNFSKKERSSHNICLHSLHELQNLYFVLLHKELEINL